MRLTRTLRAHLRHEDLAEAAGLHLRRLSRTIGTVIMGVDVRTASTSQVAAIRAVWLARRVVFLPGQNLGTSDLVTFARQLGEPTEAHPVVPGLDGHPHVFETDYEVSANLAEQYGDKSVSREQGLDWHADVTFVRRPPDGTLLNALVAPEWGGDTLWSDQVAAFASMSSPLRDFLRTLTAEHDGRDQFRAMLAARGEGRWDGVSFTEIEPTYHPVIRVHSETGEEALFVNPGFTTRIVDLGRGESDAILAYLYTHSVRHEFTVRWHWTSGDLAIWDNRATQHALLGDFEGRRVTQRVTLRGDEPRGVR